MSEQAKSTNGYLSNNWASCLLCGECRIVINCKYAVYQIRRRHSNNVKLLNVSEPKSLHDSKSKRNLKQLETTECWYVSFGLL